MNISSIDLNLLHVVLVEQHVTRAAERIHVTPSAISNSLARLREILKDPLVTRQGRGVVPTPRARELAPILARTMRDLESVVGPPPFDPATCTRVFRVAVADVGQIAWIPRLVTLMQRELPRAQLRIAGIDGLVSLGDLGSTEIDVHIGVAGRAPGLRAAPLVGERTCLVARRGHPAITVGRLSRSNAELHHVRVELVPGKHFPDPFERLFERAKVARTLVAIAPSFSTAAAIVARTDMVTMLPSSLVDATAESLRLVVPATLLPPHGIKLGMSWHMRTDGDPASRMFRALVQRVICG